MARSRQRGPQPQPGWGPAWLDTAAAGVRRLLRDYRAPACVGHGDWESQNIRWVDGEAAAVHDWDSVIAQPEVAIAGFASAVWTKQGKPGEVPSVEQSDAFLDAYERAAGVHWTRPARQAAWAAGLWVSHAKGERQGAYALIPPAKTHRGGGSHSEFSRRVQTQRRSRYTFRIAQSQHEEERTRRALPTPAAWRLPSDAPRVRPGREDANCPHLLGHRRDRHALAELCRGHQGHRSPLARLGPDGP